MAENKKILFFMCGRSGSGKDSILKGLLEINSMVKPIIPTTTRYPRVNEKNGVEYDFQTEEIFLKNEKDGNFLTYLKVDVFDENENMKTDYYGYPKPSFPVSILTGPWHIFMKIRKENPDNDNFKLVPIYITVEHEYELLYRVIKRELQSSMPKIKEVARRFCYDQEVYPKTEEIEKYIGSDHIITNIELKKSILDVNKLVQKILMEEGVVHR